MTEMSTENKNITTRSTLLSHCRTKYHAKAISYTWNIVNFWEIYNFADSLTSSSIEEQSFKLRMIIDKENQKLFFCIHNESEIQINFHRYYVYISPMELTISTNWKRFCSNSVLDEICVETLRAHESKYLFNNILSVCFLFETIESVSHNIIRENILESQMADMGDFVSDNKPASVLIFTTDNKRLTVNTSLLYASSKVFKTMLDSNPGKNEVKIDDVSYNIFRILLLYLETRGLSLNKYRDPIYLDKWEELLEAADKYDIKDLKLTCEKYLIQHTTKDNVLNHLENAFLNNANYLKNYAKRFIKLYLDDIIDNSHFLELINNIPELLSEIMKQVLLVEKVPYSTYIYN